MKALSTVFVLIAFLTLLLLPPRCSRADGLPTCFAGSNITWSTFNQDSSTETLNAQFGYIDEYINRIYPSEIVNWSYSCEAVYCQVSYYSSSGALLGGTVVDFDSSASNSGTYTASMIGSVSYSTAPSPIVCTVPSGFPTTWYEWAYSYASSNGITWSTAHIVFAANGQMSAAGSLYWPETNYNFSPTALELTYTLDNTGWR